MNQMLTPEHLTGLRRTAEKGTKGSWRFENVKHGNGLELVTDATTRHSIMWTHLHFGEPRIVFNRCEDMEYIASVCPAILLQLLDMLDTQQARITELEVLSDELLNTLNFERGHRVELERDAARLNFIEKRHDMRLSTRSGKWWAFDKFSNYEQATYSTLREAIDAAIQSASQKSETV